MWDYLHFSRRCSGSNAYPWWTIQPSPINTEYTLVHIDERVARSVSIVQGPCTTVPLSLWNNERTLTHTLYFQRGLSICGYHDVYRPYYPARNTTHVFLPPRCGSIRAFPVGLFFAQPSDM